MVKSQRHHVRYDFHLKKLMRVIRGLCVDVHYLFLRYQSRELIAMHKKLYLKSKYVGWYFCINQDQTFHYLWSENYLCYYYAAMYLTPITFCMMRHLNKHLWKVWTYLKHLKKYTQRTSSRWNLLQNTIRKIIT